MLDTLIIYPASRLNPKSYPDRYAIKKAAHLAAGRNAITLTDWIVMKEAYNHCCAYCGKECLSLEKDHVIPLSRGGTDVVGNIVPACHRCNRKKYNYDIVTKLINFKD